MSKEHVWSDWLEPYAPRHLNQHFMQSTVVNRDESQVSKEKRRSGDPHSAKLRIVCATCNNGWMSVLEGEAKSVLVPLLEGNPTKLYKKHQKTLAAWITKMVMVAEYLDRDARAVPQSERTKLRRNQTAPFNWRIWLGAQQRDTHPLWTNCVFPFEEDERSDGANANTQATTIILGDHLIFHVMRSGVGFGNRAVHRWVLPESISARMKQIWRQNQTVVLWPPAGPPLDDSEIRLLARNFLDGVTMTVRAVRP